MKKILSFIMLAIVMFTFTACGTKESDKTEGINDSNIVQGDSDNGANSESKDNNDSDLVQNGANSGTNEKNKTEETDEKDENNKTDEDNADPNIVRGGFSDGSSEPTTPFYCAYQMERFVSEEDEFILVEMSFGTTWDVIETGWLECDRVVISVINLDEEEYVFQELSAEEFFTYDHEVRVGYTYEEFDGWEEIVDTRYHFSNAESYQFPSSLCNGKQGELSFEITAYAGDKLVGWGYCRAFYSKIDNMIRFQTRFEYLTEKREQREQNAQ